MTTTPTDYATDSITQHDEMISTVERRQKELRDAIAKLTELQAQRASQKTAACVRICATNNPVTGKPYSESAAKDFAQLDGVYAAYKKRVADAELEKTRAEHAVESAKLVVESARLTADLAIALVRITS